MRNQDADSGSAVCAPQRSVAGSAILIAAVCPAWQSMLGHAHETKTGMADSFGEPAPPQAPLSGMQGGRGGRIFW